MSLDTLGAIAGFVFTLFIFSYLLSDNPLYRLAIYIFIGLTAAFTLIVTVESLLPFMAAFYRLLINSAVETDPFPAISFIVALILMIPVIIGRLPGRGVTLGLLIAVGSAVAVLGTLTGTLLPMALSTGRALRPEANLFNGLVLLAGVCTTLIYFQYAAKRTPDGQAERGFWVRFFSGIGQVFIVVTLGVLYGTAILTSLTILTARISVLRSLLP